MVNARDLDFLWGLKEQNGNEFLIKEKKTKLQPMDYTVQQNFSIEVLKFRLKFLNFN